MLIPEFVLKKMQFSIMVEEEQELAFERHLSSLTLNFPENGLSTPFGTLSKGIFKIPVFVKKSPTSWRGSFLQAW
jgi:hypothetical protein